MAPEVIQGGSYNGKADVYSFGILMYQVVTDLQPYPEVYQRKMPIFKFQTKVIEENYRPEFKVPVKPKIRELIESCWSGNPMDRPTFDEIYNRLSKNIEETIYNVFNDEIGSEYYLEDVDINEILEYTDKIEAEEKSSQNGVELLLQRMKKIEAENSQLKEKIKELEEQMNSKVDNIQQQLSALQNSKPIQQNNDSNDILDIFHIHVNINKATNLRKISDTNPNPFVKVHLKSQSRKRRQATSAALNSCDPVWNKEMNFYTNDMKDCLLIDVYQYNAESRSEGEKLTYQYEFPLKQLTADGNVHEKEINMTYNQKDAGKIFLSISATKMPRPEIDPICTFSATGERFTKQTYYNCLTCNLTEEEGMGICEACARSCHKGHDVRIIGCIDCYCDCPSKCKCLDSLNKNEFECTSVKTNGKPVNQFMYHCNDCDGTGQLFICQNCAARDHKGHDLVILGVVEGKVCQNKEIV